MASESNDTKPLVVITGVSGYLGSQTCLAFLEDGQYRVRGTVRDPSDVTKMATLEKGFGKERYDQIEFVRADLNDEASLVAACEGATYVIHTASPFHFKGDCVGPAVAGTEAVLKACTVHGTTVQKCVITSSCAAALAPAKEDQPVPPAAYDESSWSNPDRPGGLSDYMKSKTLAERAAWDYRAAETKDGKSPFDLVTILPTFILGPAPCGDGISVNWIKSQLNGASKKIPRGRRGIVDVRDVALAHVKAVQLPNAANKRFILYNERIPLPQVYEWLAPLNESDGAKIPTELADGEDVGGDSVDNTRSKEVLQIEYRPLQSTIVDHAKQLIARGALASA